MRFSDEFVRKVVESNNLVDLISQATTLKPSGNGFMGRCPFPDHKEKTASFSVSEQKQVYHCFGCKKSGNIVSFMRDYHSMTFPQAIEYLAGRANIPLPTTQHVSAEEERKSALRKEVFRANKLAMEFFEQHLRAQTPNSEVAQYVEKRKLTAETIEAFNLGLSSGTKDVLVQFLRNKGITLDTMNAAGLIKYYPDGNGHSEFFRSRLMFPIVKISGEVVGFGGRIISQGEPKYLNSRETPVFHKSNVLYGLNLTARHIRSQDHVIVVEGYMDLIALYQAGIQNVAAPLGTALTHEHAVALSKITKNITVLFDGDEAGQNAAEKTLPILLAAGLRPRGLTLPDRLDPDEFLQSEQPGHGVVGLNNLIENAPDLFNLIMARWTLKFKGDPSDKLHLIEHAQPVLEVIPDARLKDLYKTELAQKLQIQPAQLNRMLSGENSALQKGFVGRPMGQESLAKQTSSQQVLGQKSAPAADEKSENESPEQFKIGKTPNAERLLLSLAIKNRANLEMVLHSGVLEHFKSGGAKEIFQWVISSYRQNPSIFDSLVNLLTIKIDDPSVLFEADRVQVDGEATMLRDCLRKIIADSLKEQMDRLSLELKLQQDESARHAGMQKLLQLQKDRVAVMSKFSGAAGESKIIESEINAKDFE